MRNTPTGAMQRGARYLPSPSQSLNPAGGRRIPWLPATLLVLVLAFGSWIRVANIGEHEFNNDELYHYYAAQSISEGRGPALPSGHLYQRGIDITRLVAVSNLFFAPPELATRLPSTIFGIANLLLIAAVAWAIGGPWVALWATFLLAILPEAVTQSRQLRFYTYQLCFGLVGLFAVWKLVEGAGRRALHDQRSVVMQWIWAAALGWAVLMATRVQVTTLSVGAGALGAMLFAATLDLRAHGRRALTHSVPVIACVAFVLSAGAVALLVPGILRDLITTAAYVPVWAGSGAGHPLSYYYSLVESYPAVVALAPLSFVAVALRNVRLCVVLLTWFAVPVALHSFVFAWKGDRFIILAVPALLIATAVAVTMAGDTLYRSLLDRLRSGGAARGAHVLCSTLMAGAALFAIFATPAFNLARKAPGGAVTIQRHDWRTVGERIREVTSGQQVPIGTSEGLSAMFYWGGADFIVHRGATEFSGRMLQPGDADMYSGIPVYVTPDAIRARFADHPFVLIGIDRVRWEHGVIDGALQAILRADAEELCAGRCGNMLLFRWPMSGAAAAAGRPRAQADGGV